jgi:hypothetical protein
MLPPLAQPEVLEQKLVAQRGEMQNLAMENDRLAASHVAGDADAARLRPHAGDGLGCGGAAFGDVVRICCGHDTCPYISIQLLKEL